MSISDYKGGKVTSDGIVSKLEFEVKERKVNHLILRVRRSQEANHQDLLLTIGKNKYRIRPSYFVKIGDKKRTRYQYLQLYDSYEVIFETKKIYICKERVCVDEISIQHYPVKIEIEGGTLTMELLQIQ